WLQPGERPDRCLRRWQAAAAAAGARVDEEESRAADAEAAFDGVVKELQALEEELDGLRRDAQRDGARLDAFDTDLARLVADDTVTTLLGGAPAEVADIERAAGMAE